MSEVKIVFYSLGLNIAVHPEIAKSVHFLLFGEFKIPSLFDNVDSRLGSARVTIEEEVKNVDNIGRIHRPDNHLIYPGEPSKIMESVFFNPIWTPTSLRSLSKTGGWDPENNPFQSVIDFSKNDSKRSLISEISKSCRAAMECGRVFTDISRLAFISSHVILIVNDLDEFREQVMNFGFKGGGYEEDDVPRMEVNFRDTLHDLVIPYIHLGLLPLNCTVFESKDLFDLIENEPDNDDIDYVIPREVLEKIRKMRDCIMESEIYSFLGDEIPVLTDSYHTLVQSILDMDNPSISQDDKLLNLMKINKTLDFYQLSISLLKEHQWPRPNSHTKLKLIQLD